VSRAEFTAPAVLVGQGSAHRSALWRDVPYRRQVWLRGLAEGATVHVLDDYGNVFETTVRAVSATKRGQRSKEPRVWLAGHLSSYAAGRVFRPGGGGLVTAARPCPFDLARKADPLALLSPEHRASLPGLQAPLHAQLAADGVRLRAAGDVAQAERYEAAAVRTRGQA
jgi:hypothetical protein